jgi:hypothetical protein
VTIRAVFRVQCDGPCKGWLLSYTALPGSEPAAATFPGERAARVAAVNAGWSLKDLGLHLYCPDCTVNPLGVVLPDSPICVDPRCPARHAHFGPCPGPHRRDE